MSMGGAPELYQNKLKAEEEARRQKAIAERKAIEAEAHRKREVEILASNPKKEAKNDKPDEVAPKINLEDPIAKGFEMLPDEELLRIATTKNIKLDGRWKRNRIIQELMKAGATP
jgi:hypothetical protein